MIKLSLAARENEKKKKRKEKKNEENYINSEAFRALCVFRAFLFFCLFQEIYI